jgi:hypothetical protein
MFSACSGLLNPEDVLVYFFQCLESGAKEDCNFIIRQLEYRSRLAFSNTLAVDGSGKLPGDNPES